MTDDSLPRRRRAFVLTANGIAGMFGAGLKLVDVKYDLEQDRVIFVLEGHGLDEWRPGCAVRRVFARPLSTAYIMRDLGDGA